MDGLEAFENARALSKESRGQLVHLFGSETIPFHIEHEVHWEGFNRCTVAFVGHNIVVKMQKQYLCTIVKPSRWKKHFSIKPRTR